MRHITLVGMGNQGTAWAENLRDSGFSVQISGRSTAEGGSSEAKAKALGFTFIDPAELHKVAHPIALLLPDEAVRPFFEKYFQPYTRDTQTFVFAHGFAVMFADVPFQASDDVILVAPKGIAKKLRENYQAGSGVMGVTGVHQDASGNAWQVSEAIASGLGCDRVEILRSSFRGETYADLLSEQAVLCGGVPRLLDVSIRFLIEKGIPPKLAVFECLNELQLMVEMMVEYGIDGMFQRISRTARFGGLRAAEKILPDNELQPRLEELWRDIVSQDFAKALYSETEAGDKFMRHEMTRFKDHPADQVLRQK